MASNDKQILVALQSLEALVGKIKSSSSISVADVRRELEAIQVDLEPVAVHESDKAEPYIEEVFNSIRRPTPEEIYPGLDFVVRTLEKWAGIGQVNFSSLDIIRHLKSVSSGVINPWEMNGISLEVLLPGIKSAERNILAYCGNSLNDTKWLMTGRVIDRLRHDMAVSLDSENLYFAEGHCA